MELIGLFAAQPWLSLGIVIGLIARTLWPWLAKRPIPPFDWRVLYVAVAGGFAATAALLPSIQVGEWWLAMLVGAFTAVGGQTVVRYIVPALEFIKERRK